MVNSELALQENKHPNREAEKRYDLLIGIDEQKSELLKTLSLLMDRDKVNSKIKNGILKFYKGVIV